jgi:hypothetical protein
MREIDLLRGYPESNSRRFVHADLRTIKNRITASYRDNEFYDGSRNDGYGGFVYDGRWITVAKSMIEEYALTEKSAILQVNCEKGFLLHDFKQLLPGIRVCGTEVSEYAIETSMTSVRALPRLSWDCYARLESRQGRCSQR